MSDAKANTKKNNVVSAEVKLNAKSPVPLEYGGTGLSLMSGNRYIPFLDVGNDFVKTLIELRVLSVTHNACINTKTNYTVGEGLYISNLQENTTADPDFTNFFKYMNSRKENGNKIIRKVVDGYQAFGNKPVEVVRLEIKGRKFLYVYPKNFLDCRKTWPNDNNEATHVIISKRFRKGQVTFGDDQKAKVIPIYKSGPGDKKRYWLKDGKVERTIIWLQNDVEGYDHYGLPSSISSVCYQKMENDSIRFNLDNVENNMVLGGAVFLEGALTQDEADKIGSDIIKRHTGKGKAGRIAVFGSEQGLGGANWVPFDTHKDGSYIELDNKVQDKIILSHEWDPVLIGVQTKSALGKGGSYLEEIYHQKKQTVIRPLQRKILEDFWAPLMEIADEWFGKKWSTQYEFDIQAAQIVNKNSELSTIKGIEVFLKIIDKVASGAWPLEAAIKFVASKFGITTKEAQDQLGNINVRSKHNNEGNADQSGGGLG